MVKVLEVSATGFPFAAAMPENVLSFHLANPWDALRALLNGFGILRLTRAILSPSPGILLVFLQPDQTPEPNVLVEDERGVDHPVGVDGRLHLPRRCRGEAMRILDRRSRTILARHTVTQAPRQEIEVLR